jgi:hypothetical protein
VVFVFDCNRQENNRRERREDAEDEEGKLSFSSLFPLWFLYLIAIARKINRRGHGEDAKGAEKISAFFSASSVVFVFDFFRQEINHRGRGEDAEDEEGKLSFPSLLALWFLYLISIARKSTAQVAEKTQRKQRKIIVSFSACSVVFVFDFFR